MNQVTKIGILGMIGNIFLLIFKALVGFTFASQAMIADAMNSAMDIFASLMTTIGGHIATNPRDDDHQFGHEKAEYIFSLLVSLSMMVGAIVLFIDNVKGAMAGQIFTFSYLLVGVCLLTIAIKGLLYFVARNAYLQTESLLVRSNMLDHRNDILVSMLTLLSIILGVFQITIVDNIVGTGIALWIFYAGVKIFIESYRVLMDKALEKENANLIKEFILKQKDVLGITKFETVPTGGKYILVLSILVDGTLSTFQSHTIADQLEKKILKNYSEILMVTIHVNPMKKRRNNKK